MKKKIEISCNKVNSLIVRLDSFPLWWIGFVMLVIVLMPNLALREGSVFTIHDQMDESMMNYVLTARHLGSGVIPELLGGINASGMLPSGSVFLPLFQMLSPFYAFLCMYAITLLFGFEGMYFAVRELTESNILAVVSAGLFCMLNHYPIYGLSVMGLPFVLYAFLCLQKSGRKIWSYVILGIFSLGSHLVYTGYSVLGLWFLGIVLCAVQKKKIKWLCYGFLELLIFYILPNYGLIAETFGFGEGIVSHREEAVISVIPFISSVADIFINGQYHAASLHYQLILPILVLLIVDCISYKQLFPKAKERYILSIIGMCMIVLIAVFHGVYYSGWVVAWRNAQTGLFHSFQMDRFYWLYPVLWYLTFALAFSVIWTKRKDRGLNGRGILRDHMLLYMIFLAVLVYPTANLILHQSSFYQNVNQYNNGSEITSYTSWESYYAEDVMQEIDRTIGREKSEYRIGHLGVSPAPSLMHGFYTVDGYSDNYPLEYKHRFRKVIEKELDKEFESKIYFDTWGSRCYLFNSVTGSAWNLGKGSEVKYQGLEFNMDALKDLGCEYLFSAGEITDAADMGLQYMGYFESDTSYWGIWLYALTE